ncbi:hypothetical protein BJY00DRAFT_320157 [Aspergillus carlsbadensis]|nr:hypothetical protein BJY00DRAFT_320157 [Aspergillus carlsbadensis]
MNLLETYVRKGLHDVMSRLKLSSLQGGMLLLQHRPFSDNTWALNAQLRIPAWEKSLRKRLAWRIYIVDKWMALIHGRPSHIVDELDWAVEPLTEDGFPETPDDEDQEEGSGEIEAGRLSFQMLISLSEIIRLREWRRDLPASLNLESAKARKKSPIGSLHLAYYAVEISLHKAIILGLQGSSCDPSIVSVCREAARERAVTSIEFVKGLTPEQIQSFWHFSSAMNLVYIGIFTALLYLTSQTIEETQSYNKHLEEYRWTLRVMSRAANFVDFAVRRLDMSLLHLDRLSIHDIVRNSHQNVVVENESRSNLASAPKITSATTTTTAPSAPTFLVDLDGWQPTPTGNTASMSSIPTTLDDAGFEHQRFMAILDAVEAESLWSDQHNISPAGADAEMGSAGRLDFYGRDWNDVDQSEVYPALDPSPS